MKTVFVDTKKIERKWYIFDAKDQVLGRFSTKIADILRGKNKPSFSPNHDNGDYVIILNAKDIKLTGNKESNKMYYRHSRFPGGLKSESLATVKASNPEKVVFEAIKGMLPKNKLKKEVLTKLKIYASNEHNHEAQQPINLEI